MGHPVVYDPTEPKQFNFGLKKKRKTLNGPTRGTVPGSGST